MFTQSVSDILKKIRRIEIRTRNPVAEMFRGEYHSRFKGQGLEFSEVRDISPEIITEILTGMFQRVWVSFT
jgi:hypothetical protein